MYIYMWVCAARYLRYPAKRCVFNIEVVRLSQRTMYQKRKQLHLYTLYPSLFMVELLINLYMYIFIYL